VRCAQHACIALGTEARSARDADSSTRRCGWFPRDASTPRDFGASPQSIELSCRADPASPLPLPAVSQPTSGTAGGAASYTIAAREIQQQLHSQLPPTTVWGFGDGATGATYPGPTIEASVGQPIALTCPVPLGPRAPYEDYFGYRLQEGPVPSVSFSAEDARRPFLTANHGMWSFFEPALRKRLHDLDRQATMTERVRSVLLEALPAGDLAMDAVCRKLGISTRTLQRRLRDEGGSFQKTLDQVRSSLAQHYLEHSAMTNAEISFLLGFEDPNSFVRAFQRWTGTTPQTVRAARSGPASRWIGAELDALNLPFAADS